MTECCAGVPEDQEQHGQHQPVQVRRADPHRAAHAGAAHGGRGPPPQPRGDSGRDEPAGRQHQDQDPARHRGVQTEPQAEGINLYHFTGPT